VEPESCDFVYGFKLVVSFCRASRKRGNIPRYPVNRGWMGSRKGVDASEIQYMSWEVSCFRRGVDEVFVLLGCYTA
jgi:hypothetical protein